MEADAKENDVEARKHLDKAAPHLAHEPGCGLPARHAGADHHNLPSRKQFFPKGPQVLRARKSAPCWDWAMYKCN